MAGLLGLAWAASENRRAIPWRAVVAGLALLVVLAVVFLRIEFLKKAFLELNDVLLMLERATQAGTSLVFGYLGGGHAPFTVSDPAANFVRGVRARPSVLGMSALCARVWYGRVRRARVRGSAFVRE